MPALDLDKARVILNCIGKTIGITDQSQKPKLTDSFYAIGGTSINAMEAINRINSHAAFQEVPLRVEDFMVATSIQELLAVGNAPMKLDIQVRKMKSSDKDFVIEVINSNIACVFYTVGKSSNCT